MDPPESVRTTSASSSADSTSGSSTSTNDEKLKMLSVVGGEPVYFTWKLDGHNSDMVQIMFDIINQCLDRFSNMKMRFKTVQKALDDVNKEDFGQVKEVLDVFNSAASTMSKLWKGATNPEAPSWSQDFGDIPLITSICSTVFNSAVSSVKRLNSHYQPFSSEVYGETKYEQMQKIIDQLKFKDSDVFVDLGSGVGHLVLYVAGATKVKKAVGIEKASVPARYQEKMKVEYKRWMGWYKKKYRQFDLIGGDFLDEQFRDLITKEATIVFINNYAFNPDLEMKIKHQLLAEMRCGTRIISTKAYATGTKEINDRLLSDVEAILDVRELDAVPCPTSWTDKHVPYFLHTVNRGKLHSYFSERAKSNSQSASAENSRRASLSSKSSHSSREGSTAVIDASKLAMVGEAGEMDPDDESAYGPTTRHKWKEYVNDLDKKKRKGSPSTSGALRWNEADREYMPPGVKKAKKEKASAMAGPKPVKEKPEKPAKRGPGRPARARVSDEARQGMDELHQRIVSPRPLETDGAGLVRVSLGSAPVKSPSLPDVPQMAAALPAGSVVLDPNNPMDRVLIQMREEYCRFLAFMPSDEFARGVTEEIQRETARHSELLEKVREKEVLVSQQLGQGVAVLKGRLKELGMSDVETPSVLLTCSKRIVAQHKELTQSVSSREAEVACLEGRTRSYVPFGELLLDKLHLVEECPDPEKDKYTWLIQTCATESGHPMPRLESDNEGVEGGGVLSPGGPRRRARPRGGPGRKAGKSEESSEEVDRKVQEIVKAAMRVDLAAKEKERRARGAAPNEKVVRKATNAPVSSPSADPMAVPLPRSAPFPQAPPTCTSGTIPTTNEEQHQIYSPAPGSIPFSSSGI